LPKFRNDLNLFKLEILISKENLNDVNYIMAFECDDNFVPQKIKSNECNRMPSEIKKQCKSKVLYAWSFGLPFVSFFKQIILINYDLDC
jgi:hypothetical protein